MKLLTFNSMKDNIPEHVKHLLPKSATQSEWEHLLITLLHECYMEKGKLTYDIFSYWIPGRNLSRSCERVFGSWNATLKRAGFKITKRMNINNEYLLNSIRKAYKEHGYVSYNMFLNATHYGVHVSVLERRFGSFLNAVEKAGVPIESSPKVIGSRVIALDKHRCDSIEEGVLDNYLYKNNIKHEVHKKYPYHKYLNKYGLKCDFYIPDKDLYIEYAGLADSSATKNKWKKMILSKYYKKLELKQSLANILNLKLLIVYKKDISDISHIIQTIKNLT